MVAGIGGLEGLGALARLKGKRGLWKRMLGSLRGFLRSFLGICEAWKGISGLHEGSWRKPRALLRSSWAALGDRGKDVWILGKALGCAMSFFGIVGQNCVESRM